LVGWETLDLYGIPRLACLTLAAVEAIAFSRPPTNGVVLKAVTHEQYRQGIVGSEAPMDEG
jgi:hypothetical protein